MGGSKKDPTVRRREILGQGPESLGHALTEAAAASAASLLQSMLGSEVLVEVACGGEAGECASRSSCRFQQLVVLRSPC